MKNREKSNPPNKPSINALPATLCRSVFRNIMLFLVFILIPGQMLFAQMRPSLSFGHQTWPSSPVSSLDLSQPYTGSLSDLEVWTDIRFVRGSYPMFINKGKMFLDIQPGFQRIEFRHNNWTEELPHPTDAYIIDLNLIAMGQLTNKWSYVAQATPAIKSGLEQKMAGDDFAIEGALLATRQAGESTSYGFGLAYSTNFGAPIPIPLLQLDYKASLWSGGPAWRGSILLPSSIEAWVIPSKRLEVGLQLRSIGDRHHITEVSSASIKRPYSDYFDTVLGPSVILYITPWMNLNIESGFSIYRQMQITDGRDELISFEPEQAGFLRWQLTFGGQSPLRE